jgi:hypothetical protein
VDELAAHAVLVKAEQVLDARAHLGAFAVSRFLLGVERLPAWTFSQMWLSQPASSRTALVSLLL